MLTKSEGAFVKSTNVGIAVCIVTSSMPTASSQRVDAGGEPM